jgi:hypothetical protein
MSAPLNPCEVFVARRGAREILCVAGELFPHEAVDVECEFRRRARLQQQRRGEPVAGDYDLDDPWERACFEADRAAKARREREARMPAARRPVLARSTIDATAYVIQQKDPGLLRQWLAKHSAAEREEIAKMLLRLEAG